MGTEVIKTTPPEGGAVVVNTGRDPTSCRSLSTYNPQRNVDRHTSMRCRKASESGGAHTRPLGAQRIQFGQRRCINTINFTMYCAFAGHRLDSGPGCTADNRRHYERPATGRWSSSGCCLVCVVNCRKQIFALLKLKLIEQIERPVDARHRFHI